ncbi:MAG: 2-C-methyl-D-erythritol 2,4-cyclodiphosphate synthase [Chloroflexota bacterium]
MVQGGGPQAGSESRVDVIVVAAGSSSRMAGIDKRLALLGGQPLLIRTIEAMASAPIVDRIVLVMEEGAALETLRPGLPSSVVRIVPGGAHRGASVEAGFRALEAVAGGALPADRVVLVHDGARPLVSRELIDAVAAAAAENGAALPVIPVSDTVRRVRDGELGELVDRTDLTAGQTPQGARAGLLAEALRRYPAGGGERFTDEAALLMACTIRVHPVPGDPVNLKVTLPADLARAAAFVAARDDRRIGTGTDSHPFGPGAPLRLGGLEFPGVPRLHGHSDGDVVLHATADALLGAAVLGDLGRMFPADHRTPKGMPSEDLLRSVVSRLAGEGWTVEALDLTIVGARPKLAGRLDEMQVAIAALIGTPRARVSVKASTGNLEGATGAGRVISATATASIVSTNHWMAVGADAAAFSGAAPGRPS